MRDIAREAYEKCVVRGTAFMRPDTDLGDSAVDDFQRVVDVTAPALVDEGLIRIIMKHKESSSGRVDLIKFVRLR